MEYWAGLPEEHHTALFQLRDEDFAAELDAHLKYQLRICKDCRGNVTRAFRWGACSHFSPAQRGAAFGRDLNFALIQGTVTRRKICGDFLHRRALQKLHSSLLMLDVGASSRRFS